jgi:mannose-6-phosphate isomerase-like protein (cupin superfamily)
MEPAQRDAFGIEERPWGSFCVLDTGSGHKVKRLVVQPGRRLSHQMHQHRSEHWVVVSGHALCQVDGVTSEAGPGDAVDVPVGARHRLANGGRHDLVLIEVQLGGYTGEDDIVRLEDDHGRATSTVS